MNLKNSTMAYFDHGKCLIFPIKNEHLVQFKNKIGWGVNSWHLSSTLRVEDNGYPGSRSMDLGNCKHDINYLNSEDILRTFTSLWPFKLLSNIFI
jgi:hypothetical protein